MKTGGSSRLGDILKVAAGALIVVAVVFFFKNEFEKNWNQIRTFRFALNYWYLALALASVVASYLVGTWAWRHGVNRYATGPGMSFSESVGMVNTTQLTKYIPGKVWGYAMQMALVDRASVPVSAVLYINVFLALTNVFIYLLLGGAYLVASTSLLPRPILATLFAALALVYVFFLVYNSKFFGLLVAVLRKLTRRSIDFCEIELGHIMKMQAISLAAALLFGMSAWLCGAGLGFATSPRLAVASASGFLVADAVGFVAFIVPGGFGVREGFLYLVLEGLGAEPLALILPIALRIVSMLADAALGLVGLAFLRSYLKKDTA